MKKEIKMLLLDDEPKNARSALYDAFIKMAGLDLDYMPPWDVPVKSNENIIFELDIIDNTEEVMRMAEQPTRLNDHDIILLDNDWRGDKVWGLNFLRHLEKKSIKHSPIALFTQHDAVYDIAMALDAGAYAMIQKRDDFHLLNVLLSIAFESLNDF